ncbi:Uncharacterised protein [Segatella copri]|nr:Uncharacterised protein [Segatella copri]
MIMPFLTRIPIRLTTPNMQVRLTSKPVTRRPIAAPKMQSDMDERFTSARLMRLKWKSRMKKIINAAIITPDVT